jgi:hypothetical protein
MEGQQEEKNSLVKGVVSHILRQHLKLFYSGPISVRVVEVKLLPSDPFLVYHVFLTETLNPIDIEKLKLLCDSEKDEYVIQRVFRLMTE